VNLTVFYLLAAAVLVGGLGVVLSANPVTSAVFLLVSLLGVAGLFAFAGSGFLAVTQVLIYIGAVVTLFTFVVMLLCLRDGDLTETQLRSQKISSLLLAALLLGNLLAVAAFWGGSNRLAPSTSLPTMESLAAAVFGRFSLAFELMSILLLVAIVGVIALAQREKLE